MADKTRSPNAARQARFRAKQAGQNGLVQCCVWIPEAALPDMQLQAELLRKHAHLTVGPLRDPHTGKFVALRCTSRDTAKRTSSY
jgi:hypothetical protein